VTARRGADREALRRIVAAYEDGYRLALGASIAALDQLADHADAVEHPVVAARIRWWVGQLADALRAESAAFTLTQPRHEEEP